MSKVDMSPPQTYSRLFRPWDNAKLNAITKDNRHEFEENSSSDLIYSNINIQRSHFEKMTKTKLDLNDELHHSSALTISSFSLQNSIIDPLGLTSNIIPNVNEYYFGNLNGLSSSLSPTPTTSPTMIHSASPSSSSATSNAGLPTIIDPLTLSFMEHEYARVMAEDAHLKAINSRKQRPKKFKCPHCDVAFSNNGQLKGHIRIHTGERPFKCDLETCGKTFTRNEELTRHKRIHTGLRPYGCSNCGKKFGRRDHLKKHMKTHMPQERHLGPAIYVPMYPYLYGY